MRTIVFLGPSLPLAEARRLLDATFLPPARRGDVYRHMTSGVEAIILIDGVFHATPPVWHRELVAALDAGIHVVGAASMGALRAAELDVYGMVGHGTIYEWYRDGVIDGDDEVALLHGSEEDGYRALSVPLVNVRWALQQAVASERLDEATASAMLDEARQTFYAERTVSPALEELLQTCDLKRQDAASVLSWWACHGDTLPAPSVRPPETAWTLARLHMTGFGMVNGETVLQRVLDSKPALVDSLKEDLARRCFILDWARRKAIKTEPTETPAPAANWLVANGLTAFTYQALQAEASLAASLNEQAVLLAWAEECGVQVPPGVEPERWMLEQGPQAFGLPWNFNAALLQELQRTGRIREALE